MPAVIMIGGRGDKGDEPRKPLFGKRDESENESESEGESETAPLQLTGLTAKRAAKDVIAAIEAGDSLALDKALRAHYEACGMGESE